MHEIITSLLAFAAAAVLLTVTPGLDTAIVVRAALCGTRRGVAAAIGVLLGCGLWGAAATAGAAMAFAVSTSVYVVLKIVGAFYIAWVGVRLLLSRKIAKSATKNANDEGCASGWFRRGLLTNLLNPKVGLFYAAFLPQFVPDGAPVGAMMGAMTVIHVGAGAVWFAGLIFTAGRAANILRRPSVFLWLDRALGALFVTLAAKLALSSNP